MDKLDTSEFEDHAKGCRSCVFVVTKELKRQKEKQKIEAEESTLVFEYGLNLDKHKDGVSRYTVKLTLMNQYERLDICNFVESVYFSFRVEFKDMWTKGEIAEKDGWKYFQYKGQCTSAQKLYGVSVTFKKGTKLGPRSFFFENTKTELQEVETKNMRIGKLTLLEMDYAEYPLDAKNYIKQSGRCTLLKNTKFDQFEKKEVKLGGRQRRK